MLLIALTILPDGLCSWIDLVAIFNFLSSGRYPWFTLRPASEQGKLFYMCLGTVSLTNLILRYKPLINVAYATLCTRQHMRFLSQQLSISNPDNGQVLSGSLKPNQKLDLGAEQNKTKSPSSSLLKGWMIHKKSSRTRLNFVRLSRSVKITTLNHANSSTRLRASLASCRSGKNVEPAQEPPAAPTSTIPAHPTPPSMANHQTNTTAPASGLNNKDHHHHQDVCIITNANQFERHFVQLDLFVSEVDRQAPSALFALSIINMVITVHTIFFVFELIYQDQYRLWLIVLYMVARLLPLMVLFVIGHSFEMEKKKLLSQLEVIYLQDPTQCLIYKHISDALFSMARIFKLLGSIRFNSDDLMVVNMETMKRYIIYIATTVFIIKQYDALIVAEYKLSNNATGGSQDVGSLASRLNNEYVPKFGF